MRWRSVSSGRRPDNHGMGFDCALLIGGLCLAVGCAVGDHAISARAAAWLLYAVGFVGLLFALHAGAHLWSRRRN